MIFIPHLSINVTTSPIINITTMKTLYDSGKVHEEYICDENGVLTVKKTYDERHGMVTREEHYKGNKVISSIMMTYNDQGKLHGRNAYIERKLNNAITLAIDYTDGKMGHSGGSSWTYLEKKDDIEIRCIFKPDHVFTMYKENNYGVTEEYKFVNGKIQLTDEQKKDPKNYFTLSIDEQARRVIKTPIPMIPNSSENIVHILLCIRDLIQTTTNGNEYTSDKVKVMYKNNKVSEVKFL